MTREGEKVKISRKYVLALLVLSVSVAAAVYAVVTIRQSISITVGTVSISGPTSLGGSASPCTSSCNGVLIAGASGAAVTFNTATGITGDWTTSSATVPTQIVLVPTSVTSCGTSPSGIAGAVAVPQATASSLPVIVQSYDYCVYYVAIPSGALLSVSVTLNGP